MKKFLFSLLAAIGISYAYAQTNGQLVIENFTGYTNGNLNGQGGWTNTGNADFVQVDNTTPLYNNGGRYINLIAKDNYFDLNPPFIHLPDDPTTAFNSGTNVATNAASTFYLTFVVKVPSAIGVASTNQATQIMALRTSGGDNIANFYIATNGTNVFFGIDKNGGSNAVYNSAPGVNYNFNTSYLIVIRFDVVTGNNNDNLYMWVNPDVSSEPQTSLATVSITSGNDGYTAGGGNTISSFQLFQNNRSATSSIDAIRLAYATGYPSNPPLAWSAIGPSNIPALPVKFGGLKGYPNNNGIQIEWDVYSEVDVVKYDIERSFDGINFKVAGSVTAKNQDGHLYYEWFDNSPSSGNNYYRIKNVDIDGKSTYSPIVKISLSKSEAGLTLYPNPVRNNYISIQVSGLQKGDYKIEIFNMGGQQIYNKQFSHRGGSISQVIELPASIKAGAYNIRFTGTGFNMAKQFLVQ